MTVSGHVLACSGEQIMKQYPWYSVDSTSWLAPVVFGREMKGLDTDELIKKAAELDPYVYVEKLKQREVILEKSIKIFLKLEQDVTEVHKTMKFSNLTQGDMFE